MLFVSGKSPHLSITHRVYDFFTERYEIASDVEVFHTNLSDENGDPEYPCDKHPELSERIFNDVGNVDHIYTVIQECVDEATEEQYMAYQQELTEV